MSVLFQIPEWRIPSMGQSASDEQKKFLTLLWDVFRLKADYLRENVHKVNKYTILCSDEQFARFIVERNKRGVQNMVKELAAEALFGEDFKMPENCIDTRHGTPHMRGAYRFDAPPKPEPYCNTKAEHDLRTYCENDVALTEWFEKLKRDRPFWSMLPGERVFDSAAWTGAKPKTEVNLTVHAPDMAAFRPEHKAPWGGSVTGRISGSANPPWDECYGRQFGATEERAQLAARKLEGGARVRFVNREAGTEVTLPPEGKPNGAHIFFTSGDVFELAKRTQAIRLDKMKREHEQRRLDAEVKKAHAEMKREQAETVGFNSGIEAAARELDRENHRCRLEHAKARVACDFRKMDFYRLRGIGLRKLAATIRTMRR